MGDSDSSICLDRAGDFLLTGNISDNFFSCLFSTLLAFFNSLAFFAALHLCCLAY